MRRWARVQDNKAQVETLEARAAMERALLAASWLSLARQDEAIDNPRELGHDQAHQN
jgi:hypothetical protein